MEFTYLTQPPNRWTFKQPKLKEWVEAYCEGSILNLFAGKTKLSILLGHETRVDIDPLMPADYHMDAYDFVVKTIAESTKFDTIVLDPPYNIRKAREKYGSRWIGKLTKIKNLLPEIISTGGQIISLGYDSVGMSKSRGFKKIAICLVCHGGDHNDTICLVEEKE